MLPLSGRKKAKRRGGKTGDLSQGLDLVCPRLARVVSSGPALVGKLILEAVPRFPAS